MAGYRNVLCEQNDSFFVDLINFLHPSLAALFVKGRWDTAGSGRVKPRHGVKWKPDLCMLHIPPAKLFVIA